MITIIIPTVNRPTLELSVNSLINQTNPNWNALILFDGIKKRNFKDKRIKTLSIPKVGRFGLRHGNAGLVRNVGISKVKTEWIGFLDDDDTLTPDYVELLLNKYKDYDLVVFRMKWHTGRIIPNPLNNDIVLNDVGISFAYKSKYKNEFINSDGEDFDFLDRLKTKVKNYIVAEEVTYSVRQ